MDSRCEVVAGILNTEGGGSSGADGAWDDVSTGRPEMPDPRNAQEGNHDEALVDNKTTRDNRQTLVVHMEMRSC